MESIAFKRQEVQNDYVALLYSFYCFQFDYCKKKTCKHWKKLPSVISNTTIPYNIVKKTQVRVINKSILAVWRIWGLVKFIFNINLHFLENKSYFLF